MFNVFSTAKVYSDGWKVVDNRLFNQEELDCFVANEVVQSEFGASVKFYLKEGGFSFIPLSREATVAIGMSINPATARIITLERTANGVTETIYRVFA